MEEQTVQVTQSTCSPLTVKCNSLLTLRPSGHKAQSSVTVPPAVSAATAAEAPTFCRPDGAGSLDNTFYPNQKITEESLLFPIFMESKLTCCRVLISCWRELSRNPGKKDVFKCSSDVLVEGVTM